MEKDQSRSQNVRLDAENPRAMYQMKEKDVVDAHINLYVNGFSISIGKEGKKAVEMVFEKKIERSEARRSGLFLKISETAPTLDIFRKRPQLAQTYESPGKPISKLVQLVELHRFQYDIPRDS